MPINCATPTDLVNASPCLNCLSQKQLLAVLVFLWKYRTFERDGTTIAEISDASACWNCTSTKQKLVGMVSLWADVILGGEGDPTIDEIKEDIKCLDCASESQLLGMLLYLVCYYYEEQN